MAHDPRAAMADEPPPIPSPERIQELLFDAARLGRSDMILPLISAGADLAATDAKGYTPLILATYHGHGDAARTLLDCGAAIDQPDGGRGNTALMGVAFKGYTALAEQLLEAGADPHALNRAGQSALMFAALFGHGDIATMLLERGADPHARDAAGNSAISVAKEQGNAAIVSLLHASTRGG